MTDNEIIKALEYCSSHDDCDLNCPIEKETTEDEGCIRIIGRLALDIINRQKAEIERLKGPSRAYPFCNLLGGCLVFSKNLKDYNDMRKGLKSEARKEFAERVTKKAASRTYAQILESDLDEVLAEMESESE